MTKLSITLFANLFLLSIASAQTHTHMITTNSLPRAALEITAMNNPHETTGKVATHYSHNDEKNNSLARGALARQGVKVNILVTADSELCYSRYEQSGEQNNSLSRGALIAR